MNSEQALAIKVQAITESQLKPPSFYNEKELTSIDHANNKLKMIKNDFPSLDESRNVPKKFKKSLKKAKNGGYLSDESKSSNSIEQYTKKVKSSNCENDDTILDADNNEISNDDLVLSTASST